MIYSLKNLPFHAGEYLMSVGVWDSTGHVAFDQHDKLHTLKIEGGGAFEETGLMDLPGRWEAQGSLA